MADRPAERLSEEVLRAAVARNPEALGSFFDFYADRVFGLAYRMLGDRTLAEDVSQEVFLKIHRAIHTLDPARDATPWVHTVTANACREVWRSRAWKSGQRSVPLDEVEDWHREHPRDSQTPDADLLTKERAGEVQEALMGISETLREVVLLHNWKGHTHKEIAEMLGTSHAAIRKRYSRALSELAKRLRGSS